MVTEEKRKIITLWQQGLALANKGDFPGAINSYREALAEAKDLRIELMLYLAEAYERNNNLLLAAETINMAIECLENAEDKGSCSFQLHLRMRQGEYNRKVGNIRQAAEGYRLAAVFCPKANIYRRSGAYSSYLQTLACREIALPSFRSALEGYDSLFSPHKAEVFAPAENRKLRIGYMSPDFRQHVMFSFYYVMLNGYDRENFFVVCYNLSSKQDGWTEHIQSMVDEWREVADLSMEELAARIKSDRIDILVDLAGHSAGSGMPVFSFWPAPVQISGLGWMETTGFYAVDYLLTDGYLDGNAAESYLTEEPLMLSSQFCYTGRSDVPVPGQAPCLKNGYITFGSFNSYHKISDDMVAIWSEILRRVPGSCLFLKCQVFIDEDVKHQALMRFEKLGIASGRLILEPATSNYMERYLSVDIALDTYPYAGGGTTLDALYMGVPVVSRYGRRRSSRFGLSILSNSGLGWLAADTWKKYMELAVQLAGDVALVNDLHLNLRSLLQRSNVMNGRKYMKELETAYKELAGRD